MRPIDWTDNLSRAGRAARCLVCEMKQTPGQPTDHGGIRHMAINGDIDAFFCAECLRELAISMREAGAFVHALETVCPDCRGQGTAPGSLYQASGGRWLTTPCSTCKGKRLVVLEAVAPLETLGPVVSPSDEDPVVPGQEDPA